MPSTCTILVTWVDDSPMSCDGVRIETGEMVSLPASIARGYISLGKAVEGEIKIEAEEIDDDE